MEIPVKIAWLRWLTVIVGIYGVVWIGLEGAMWQVILLAVGLTLLGALWLLLRTLGGRLVTAKRWLLVSAVFGAAAGIVCALLVLGLMAVKTGLHGHGPEFTATEIEWVTNQMLLWVIAGFLTGLGVGTLTMAFQRPKV